MTTEETKTKQSVMDEMKVLLLEVHDMAKENTKLIANSAIEQNVKSILTKWFGGVNNKKTNVVTQTSGKAYRKIDYKKDQPVKKKLERKAVADEEENKEDVGKAIEEQQKAKAKVIDTQIGENPLGLKGD